MHLFGVYGLAVIEVMTMPEHLSNIDEIIHIIQEETYDSLIELETRMTEKDKVQN